MPLFKQASVIDEVVDNMQKIQAEIASADEHALVDKQTQAMNYLYSASAKLRAAGLVNDANAVEQLIQKTAAADEELLQKAIQRNVDQLNDIREHGTKEEMQEYIATLIYLRSLLLGIPDAERVYDKMGLDGVPQWVRNLRVLGPKAIRAVMRQHMEESGITPQEIDQQAMTHGFWTPDQLEYMKKKHREKMTPEERGEFPEEKAKEEAEPAAPEGEEGAKVSGLVGLIVEIFKSKLRGQELDNFLASHPKLNVALKKHLSKKERKAPPRQQLAILLQKVPGLAQEVQDAIEGRAPAAPEAGAKPGGRKGRQKGKPPETLRDQINQVFQMGLSGPELEDFMRKHPALQKALNQEVLSAGVPARQEHVKSLPLKSQLLILLQRLAEPDVALKYENEPLLEADSEFAGLRDKIEKLIADSKENIPNYRRTVLPDIIENDDEILNALTTYLSEFEQQLDPVDQLKVLDKKLVELQKEEKRTERKKQQLRQRHKGFERAEKIQIPLSLMTEEEKAALTDEQRQALEEHEAQLMQQWEQNRARRKKEKELAESEFGEEKLPYAAMEMSEQEKQRRADEMLRERARKQMQDEAKKRYMKLVQDALRKGEEPPPAEGEPALYEHPPVAAPKPAEVPKAAPKEEEPEFQLPEVPDWLTEASIKAEQNYKQAMRILAVNGLVITAKKKKKDKGAKNPGKTEDEKREWRMYGYSADDGGESTGPGLETMGDPDDKFQVILLRGPNLPARIFYESKKKKAKAKAEAIADLHNTQPVVSEDGKTFTIEANDYYSELGGGKFDEEKPGLEERELLEDTPEELDVSFED